MCPYLLGFPHLEQLVVMRSDMLSRQSELQSPSFHDDEFERPDSRSLIPHVGVQERVAAPAECPEIRNAIASSS